MVFLTYPVSKKFLIFLDNLDTVIATAAVNNDVLQIGVILIQYRQDGAFNKLPLVERGCDDRKFWQIRHLWIILLGIRNKNRGGSRANIRAFSDKIISRCNPRN